MHRSRSIALAALVGLGITTASSLAFAADGPVQPWRGGSQQILPGVTLQLDGTVFERVEPQRLVDAKRGETVFLFMDRGAGETAVQKFDGDGDLTYLAFSRGGKLHSPGPETPAKVERNADGGYTFQWLSHGISRPYDEGPSEIGFTAGGEVSGRYYSTVEINGRYVFPRVAETEMPAILQKKMVTDEVAISAMESRTAMGTDSSSSRFIVEFRQRLAAQQAALDCMKQAAPSQCLPDPLKRS